jgi:hypothetical protein
MHSICKILVVALLHFMVQSLHVGNFLHVSNNGVKHTILMSSADEIDLSNKRKKFIHWNEYPNDNYNHILGFNDPNHIDSTLQKITALRIADVERSKTPIDTVSI